MNFQHIKYALAIKKYGSITKASKMLFISQPNMSNAIKLLEKDLNFKIFKRSSSGTILTSMGLKFLNDMEPIVDDLETVFNKYSNHKSDDNDENLSISILSSSMYESTILNTQKENNLLLNINQKDLVGLISDILSGLSNVGFIYFPGDLKDHIYSLFKDNGICYKEIIEDYFYILTSNDNDINENSLALDQLKNYSYISYYGIFNESLLELSSNASSLINYTSKEKISVSNRISAYLTLSMIPNTISFSSKIPENMLHMYNLKQIPLKDYPVQYSYIYTNNIDSNPTLTSIIDLFKLQFEKDVL